MHASHFYTALVFTAVTGLFPTAQAQDTAVFPTVSKAMKELVEKNEIAGSVTLVVTKDKVLHSEAVGQADIAGKRAMADDSVFWIASMSKPVTGVALLILQDEGKLAVTDPVAKYIPEFANLKTPSGQAANLTIKQIMSHTSGLGEAESGAASKASTLEELVPLWLAAPMQYEPGEKWKYTQSGINAGARIVEIVSGQKFDKFLEEKLFQPLGMKNTTFYPSDEQNKRLALGYAKNKETGALEVSPPRPGFGKRSSPPLGNGGLYSTGRDYSRFIQMLLGGGEFEGRRYLSADAMQSLMKPITGELPTGFFQTPELGNRGANYGWALGTCVLLTPHEGVSAKLSPGTFGHGGAWGTQAWADPVKGIGYILMIQRVGINSDASHIRQAFQEAAAADLAK